MRIEELVLEGFKSYPVRTQITGWDSSFNAITGLNGTGKSNILDAICFVLGITNMSSMRAQNQQDLIYKRGQAGVTKASVTIVFDNSDREKSPVGLENCKQITVTRQIALPNVSKYLLNGHKSQQQIIQTLFQGVQLNINNPNFLIMQGRITKVLNMRPQEILGMVEEAAGTRMFEDRKDKARKTMGKKEKKVDEITNQLEEEIVPALDKLRVEKRAFLLWQKSCSELEKISRMLRAWEWNEGKDRVAKKEADIAGKKEDREQMGLEKERFIGECKAAEQDLKEVQRKRDAELKKGGKLKKKEEEVAELERVVEKTRTQVGIKEGEISDEMKNVNAFKEEASQLETALATKQLSVNAIEAELNEKKSIRDLTKVDHDSKDELYQTLLTGLSSSNNAGGGYLGQLSEARQKHAQAKSQEDNYRRDLDTAKEELKAAEKKWAVVEKEAGAGRSKLDRMKHDVESLRMKVEQTGWNHERDQAMGTALQQARNNVTSATRERDMVKHKLAQLDFSYSSSPNFDRSKVKGLVASLIHLNPEHFNKSTALEITAGGKLYNVVVEDERVGKELLTNGNLRRRVTIIPLSKITSYRMPAQTEQAASQMSQGKAKLAISLIGYDDEVSRAMSYVFGNTLICDDAASAKLVTFSKQLGGVRSVTLDGDVYDPSGTLSGGAAPSGSGILVKVQELQAVEQKLKDAISHLRELEREAESLRPARNNWESMARDLELQDHQMNLLQQQVDGSNAQRIRDVVDRLTAHIDGLKSAIKQTQDEQTAADELCNKLKKDMEEFKDNKEGKTKELKEEIEKLKRKFQKQDVEVKSKQKEVQTQTIELEQTQGDIARAHQGATDADNNISKLRAELDGLLSSFAECEASFKEAARKVQEERATLTRFDNELRDLDQAIKDKNRDISELELSIQQIGHDLQALVKDKASAQTFVSNLEKMHEWIEEEKHNFGKAGSAFDFNKTNMLQLRDQAQELENQMKGMKKKINPKAKHLIDDMEKKETALKKMLSTVLADKQKIEQTIEELDRYKRDALQKTWEKVNGDFGGIFAELLPGNFAKLQPPEGQDLMQGLEVKVQLGSIWKQSLTELSGGQRSLIALSLIMSLLQFKPAPMYILDEIDAALDLSHTQHIGQLFRTRFKGSQFIVVSLKEGLFTNANVLFRTRFRDGTSIVDRTAQRSTSSLYGEQEKENEGSGARRARTART